jgi:hypothetical protein
MSRFDRPGRHNIDGRLLEGAAETRLHQHRQVRGDQCQFRPSERRSPRHDAKMTLPEQPERVDRGRPDAKIDGG